MDRTGITVSATFIDREPQRIVQLGVPVDTGLSSIQARITQACHDAAVALGHRYWVQPGDMGEDQVWFAFRCAPFRQRVFLKSFTSRDAAEMWVLHHAE